MGQFWNACRFAINISKKTCLSGTCCNWCCKSGPCNRLLGWQSWSLEENRHCQNYITMRLDFAKNMLEIYSPMKFKLIGLKSLICKYSIHMAGCSATCRGPWSWWVPPTISTLRFMGNVVGVDWSEFLCQQNISISSQSNLHAWNT